MTTKLPAQSSPQFQAQPQPRGNPIEKPISIETSSLGCCYDRPALRDHFAGQFLAAQLVRPDDTSFPIDGYSDGVMVLYVRAAYAWADAMLAVRDGK